MCFTKQFYHQAKTLVSDMYIHSCNTIAIMCIIQAWGKHLGQMLEALPQVLGKVLSTSTSTNASRQ